MSQETSSPSPTAAGTTAKRVSDIPSMLLPVQGRQLLLPGVAVAEIVNYSYAERPDDAPPWLFGYITWRKLAVPLISFELLNGQEMPPRTGGTLRIAVLNNTGVNDELPFIAIPILAIPRLVRILPRDVNDVADAELSSAELEAVNLSTGETVFIPDVSVLERAMCDYLQQR